MYEEYADQIVDLFPQGKQFRICYDSSVGKLKLLAKSYKALQEICDAFSDVNPSAFFSQQYGYAAQNKISVVNKFGYFSPGLVFEILAYIRRNYGSLDVLMLSKNCLRYIDDFLRPFHAYFKTHDTFELLNVADDSGRNIELQRQGKNKYEYRDYQSNSILSLMQNGFGRGVIEIPTAGGKSFILGNFIYNIFKQINSSYKFLLFVPNKQLVSQMYSDLLDYGLGKFMKITRFTAGLKKHEAFDKNATVIIANRQYVFNNVDKLPKIDVFIGDEIHQCINAGASYDFIENLNCKIKVGCSGTLPRNKLARWKMLGLFAKVVYVENITDLQQRGFISDVKIKSIQVIDKNVENNRNLLFNKNSLVKYHADDETCQIRFDDAHNAEIEYINKYYRELYQPILKYIQELQGNTLVLFDKIEFGTNMFELAKEQLHDKQLFYTDGATPVDIREQIRAKLEQINDAVYYANVQIMGTGINIKNLHNIVFFFSGKSYSRVIQSIGRTLRLAKDKTHAQLIDVSFNFKYSHRHMLERMQIYKQAYNKKPDEVIKLEI